MHPLPRDMSASEKQAWDLLRPAAERGLLKAPVHLVFGPSAIQDCLSPYCRDLNKTLERWADKQSIPTPALHPETRVYAAAKSFCESHPQLELERRSQEHLVGITNSTIDTRRLDLRAMDGRLNPEALSPFNAVFILVKSLNPGLEPETALALIRLLGDLIGTIAIACPKEVQSESFMTSLREELTLPVHLLDTHPDREHSSACRYLNNLNKPSAPEPTKPSAPNRAPLPKTPVPGRYLRIKA